VKKFPHLVQMHRTFAADGLVCMSVNSVDTDPGEKEKVLKFLTEKGASFPNFILKDSEENWKKWNDKYPTNVPPTIILFNRKGEQAKVLETPNDREVEDEVKKLLAAK
jgi:hypothetical protein